MQNDNPLNQLFADEEEEILVDPNDQTIPDDEGSDELIQEPFNPSEINIVPKQDTLRNLIERLRHNEIDMNTEFQRHGNLWDNQKMSRLIESILIRFPLPSFYFDASNEDNWLIVDGLQRLSSIKKFVIDKKLKLHGLEYLKDFTGKSYDDLPRTYQRRIDECPVTLFLIQPGTPEAVKYSIFRRINTGGLTLNDQEIRNAMASPGIRNYLADLSLDENFIKIMGDQSKRMVDQELVLRFLAFHYLDYEQSKKNISTFLDEMVQKLESSSEEDLATFKSAFKIAMKRSWDIFGAEAFEKTVNGENGRRKRKNSALFETWANALANVSEDDMQILTSEKESLIKRNNELLMDNEFIKAITYSTQKKDHFRIRRDMVKKLLSGVIASYILS
ncbi:MAG: DUF262 domain-containing protein [Candidatus Riflebacteria bacterium]